KDYHLGLQVEFKLIDAADPKESVNFCYQTAGPLRMPIEGVWYTNTFRNAVIGGYAAKGRNVWRDLQDSRTIDFQGGGRDLLRAPSDDKSSKFGGVATQYFASMMVVDNEQKETDFISWARPTLETPSPDPNQPGLADITVRLNAKAELKGS